MKVIMKRKIVYPLSNLSIDNIIIMLRKEGRARHESPLPKRVGSCLYADGCRVFAYSSLTSSQRCVGYRVFRSWFRLAGIPNQSCHCPCFPSWTYDWGRCGSTSYLSPKVGENKIPHQIVRITDGGIDDKHLLYRSSIFNFTLDNPNLSGAKLVNNQRPCKGH